MVYTLLSQSCEIFPATIVDRRAYIPCFGELLEDAIEGFTAAALGIASALIGAGVSFIVIGIAWLVPGCAGTPWTCGGCSTQIKVTQ